VGLLASIFGKKNPIKSMSLDDLKIAQIQLKRRAEDIHSEIQRLEHEEKNLIGRGQDTESNSEKKSLSGLIINVRGEKDAKLRTQTQILNQLRSVSNLIIIKEQWSALPDSVKKVLLDTPPEKMEGYLADMMFDAKSETDQRSLIIHMTDQMLNTLVDSTDDEDGILPELLSRKKESPVVTREPASKPPKKEFE
jgi:hypothetical protein